MGGETAYRLEREQLKLTRVAAEVLADAFPLPETEAAIGAHKHILDLGVAHGLLPSKRVRPLLSKRTNGRKIALLIPEWWFASDGLQAFE